jgi:hypothetical protein
MSASSLTICPTCEQPLTLDEQRHAFCFRCGKRLAGSQVVKAPPSIPIENAPQGKPLAGTFDGVLPRWPLLLLSAAFTLLSIGPPYPLLAVFIPIRFILTTNVFCLTSPVLLAAAITCSYYSKTRSTLLRSVAIALCAAAILGTTIWGITVKGDRSISSLVNYVFCFMIAHIAAALAREHAAAMGRRSWQHWLGVASAVLIIALIARVFGMLLFPIALAGYYLGMIWVSCALWILSLSSARNNDAGSS